MAETRTYDPSEPEGIQRLVREALGESIRPAEPGAKPHQRDADERPASLESSAADLPTPGAFGMLWGPPEG